MKDYSNYSKEQLIKYVEELKKDLKTNKYGLYWDKNIEEEDIIKQCKEEIPYLKIKKELIANPKSNKGNILIEGDNFASLTILNMMYSEPFVDAIYIDPPYNTGNNDFVYNDEYIERDNGYRHSKWLSLMSRRLSLSRNILKDDGVIFISIDDNELAQLKMLCDKIFGSSNFVQNFLWNKSSGGSSLSKYTRTDYEYILCYAKNISKINYEFMGRVSEGMGDSSLLNKPNKYNKLKFRKNAIFFPNCKEGKIKAFKEDDLELHNDLIIKDSHNQNDVEISGKWKWMQETLDMELDEGAKIISKSLDLRLRYIRNNAGSIIKPTKSITINDGVGYTVTGSSELTKILNNKLFSYPKPVSLMKYLINMVTYHKKDAIVLDYFAGSGTTAQALLEINEADKGNRRFILCTNNENEICEKVTYPRLSTVITGKREDGSRYSDGIKDNLFYYSIGFIKDTKNSTQAKYNLVKNIGTQLCVIENTYNVCEENDYFTHYSSLDNKKHLFFYFEYYDENKIKSLKEKIRKSQGDKIVYVFSDDEYIDYDCFADLPGVSLKSVPAKMYQIYKEIIENIKNED